MSSRITEPGGLRRGPGVPVRGIDCTDHDTWRQNLRQDRDRFERGTCREVEIQGHAGAVVHFEPFRNRRRLHCPVALDDYN